MQTPPWYVLTGGPCTGKTTLVNELKDRGYFVLPEAARTIIAAQLATGKTIQEILADPRTLEKGIMTHQAELESQAPKEDVVFIDRGIPDNIAYFRKFGLDIDEASQRMFDSAHYRKIFLLDMIDFANDPERYEQDPEEAKWLHREIQRVYEELGYDIVVVPVVPVPERAAFVLARL